MSPPGFRLDVGRYGLLDEWVLLSEESEESEKMVRTIDNMVMDFDSVEHVEVDLDNPLDNKCESVHLSFIKSIFFRHVE